MIVLRRVSCPFEMYGKNCRSIEIAWEREIVPWPPSPHSYASVFRIKGSLYMCLSGIHALHSNILIGSVGIYDTRLLLNRIELHDVKNVGHCAVHLLIVTVGVKKKFRIPFRSTVVKW